MYLSLSGPLSHLTPSVLDSDKKLRTDIAPGAVVGRCESIACPAISRQFLERIDRARNCSHWTGISQEVGVGVESKTRDHEQAAATLGDSEVSRVQYSRVSQVTEPGKLPDDLL
jgi:hypothetical protein